MVRRTGFGLVEVIVALTLLTIGLLAVAASAGMATLLLNQAELQEQAAVTAAQLIDSLTHAPAPATGRQRRGPFEIAWTVRTDDPLTSVELSVTFQHAGRPVTQHFSSASLRP